MAETTKRKGKDARSKRERVVDAAAKLFVSQGFGATGMDSIAEEAGVSKATLYSYYRDKSTLFADVMHRMCDEMGGARPEDLAGDTPEATLSAVATLGLHKVMETIDRGLLPRAVAEAREFPELGKKFWESGPARLEAFVAGYFADAKRRRILAVKDPQGAAARFVGLMTGMYLLPMLMGVRGRPSEADLRRDIDELVSGFLSTLRQESRTSTG
jgi:TetR/AcrR family transcriptional regulator, mexJK operon transcriptional repressor